MSERVLLVVDDEDAIREVVARIAARRRGSDRILTAPDASAAEALCQLHEVTGILTDLRMPGRSGIDLVRAARASGSGPRCAIMTGFQEDVIDGVPLAELGLVAVLRKPFSTAEVSRVIESLLDAPEAPDPGTPPRGAAAVG